MPTEVKFLTAQQFLVTTLLVKLAVVAVLATMLVRFQFFRRILQTERRDWPERLIFAFALGIPLSAGVTSRLLLQYNAADLSLAGPFLAGLVAGPYAGAIVGGLVGFPAAIAGEVLALPFAVGCGFAGGGLREMCPKEAIWHFSPFVFTGLHRYAWRFLRRFQLDWQILLIAAPLGLELLRIALGTRFGIDRLFFLGGASPELSIVVVFATVLSVAIPIKIWNSARIEHKLQEQEKLLLAARVQALSNQINPHFLFNTLTSISSLIRSRPETARLLIVRLSGLLRRLLRSQDHFTTVRDEVAAVDEYLDIECVRFPQLRVEKALAPESLDLLVPSMILQPLVENSIKHGLAPRVGGGVVGIRTWLEGTRLKIEVRDNGLGMSDAEREMAMTRGIGLRNVAERLRVIYGAGCRLDVSSRAGEGTEILIEFPELMVPEQRSA